VAPGGPIFSVAPLRTNPTDQQQPGKAPAAAFTADGTGSGVAVPTIFCGNASKEVVSWQPFMPSFTDVGSKPALDTGRTKILWMSSSSHFMDGHLFTVESRHLPHTRS